MSVTRIVSRGDAGQWTATLCDGLWESEQPGIANYLQAICEANPRWLPDRDWSWAGYVKDEVPGIEIVTPEPQDANPPDTVY